MICTESERNVAVLVLLRVCMHIAMMRREQASTAAASLPCARVPMMNRRARKLRMMSMIEADDTMIVSQALPTHSATVI